MIPTAMESDLTAVTFLTPSRTAVIVGAACVYHKKGITYIIIMVYMI